LRRGSVPRRFFCLDPPRYFRVRPGSAAGWRATLRSRAVIRTSRDALNTRASHTRNARSEPIRREYTHEVGCRSPADFAQSCYRPRIEAKSRRASFERRHSLGPWAALGAVKRASTPCDGGALRGSFANKSSRAWLYIQLSGIQPTAVDRSFLLF